MITWRLIAATHSGPLGACLPLTADLHLAGTADFGPLQVSTVARVDVEGAVSVDLATQDLSVLHAQAAGLTAFRPLSNIPAAEVRMKTALCHQVIRTPTVYGLFRDFHFEWRAGF